MYAVIGGRGLCDVAMLKSEWILGTFGLFVLEGFFVEREQARAPWFVCGRTGDARILGGIFLYEEAGRGHLFVEIAAVVSRTVDKLIEPLEFGN